MWFGVVTLFPEMFSSLATQGVVGRAINAGHLSLDLWNPRDFTSDRHKTVDDRPYGGGPGMLMKIDPLESAITRAKQFALQKKGVKPKVLYMSPQGRRLDQDLVKTYSQESGLLILAGRYEGVDERLIASSVDEEVSLGDFVLSGGEIPAMALIDAVARWVPGVLGHEASAVEDSFYQGLLDCPHYTRPEVYNEMSVPDVLLGGNHKEIARWRLKQSLGRTWERRPDLIESAALTKEMLALLEEYKQERH